MLATRITYGLSPRYPSSIPKAFSSFLGSLSTSTRACSSSLPLQTKDEDYDGLVGDGGHSSGVSHFVSVSALAGGFLRVKHCLSPRRFFHLSSKRFLKFNLSIRIFCGFLKGNFLQLLRRESTSLDVAITVSEQLTVIILVMDIVFYFYL